MKNPMDNGSNNFLAIGSRVFVGDKAKRPGTLRFLGTVHFVDGVWCGVELDEEEGLHDGLVQDVRYFTCAPKKGVFAPLTRVQPMTCNNNNLFRNKNHGVLFDCPFESDAVVMSICNRVSRLPRPAYSTASRYSGQPDDISINEGKSLDMECLLDVKNQDIRLRKSSSPKKVTFDMEPEFLDGDLEFRWKKSRSENDSLLLFESEMNSNDVCSEKPSHNIIEPDNVVSSATVRHHPRSIMINSDKRHPAPTKPKSISASLDAVESDLNDLLQKIDKEISNVKTPDTADITNFIPDFFAVRINRNQNTQIKDEITRALNDDDDVGNVLVESSSILIDQRKLVADESNDDIMLLTGSPSFRLAQTAMVQYAELLKASQAGLVAQKARFQLPNSDKLVKGMSNTTDGCSTTDINCNDSHRKTRIHLDSSNSTSSSTDDLYEIFDGEDLPTLKIFPDEEFDVNSPPVNALSSLSQKNEGDQICDSSKSECTSEDVCSFLDSLLKSGQELEKWLEISVADLNSPENPIKTNNVQVSNAPGNLIEFVDCANPQEPKVILDSNSNLKLNEYEDMNDVSISNNGIKITELHSESVSSSDDISKARPLSYASTVDSCDTGCQMELDHEDLMQSFNLEESLIDIGTTSDSLLLESWNEIFQSDSNQQGIDSIEKLVLDYLDGDINESTTEKPVDSDIIIGRETDFMEFVNFAPGYGKNSADISSTIRKSATTDLIELNNEAQLTISSTGVFKEDCSYSFEAMESLGNAGDSNFNFKDLKSLSMQNFIDETASDSQEANASGLSSTPGSSFSSYGSSQRDHDLLPQDILNESIENRGLIPLDALLYDQNKNDVVEIELSKEKKSSFNITLATNEILEITQVEHIADGENESNRDFEDKDVDETSRDDEPTEKTISDTSITEPQQSANVESATKSLGKNITVNGTKDKSIPDGNNTAHTSSGNPEPKVASTINKQIKDNKTKKEVTITAPMRNERQKTGKLQQISIVPLTKPLTNNSRKLNLSNTSSSNTVSFMNKNVINSYNRIEASKTTVKLPEPNSNKINSSTPSNQKTTKSSIPFISFENKLSKIVEKPLQSGSNKVTNFKSDSQKDNNRFNPTITNPANSSNTGHTTEDSYNRSRSSVLAQESRKVTSKNTTNKRQTGAKESPNDCKLKNIKGTVQDNQRQINKATEVIHKSLQSSLPVKKSLNTTRTIPTGSEKSKQASPYKPTTDLKTIKNVRNTMVSENKHMAKLTNSHQVNELTGLKNKLNASKNPAENHQKEKESLEKVTFHHERQYRERITKFEKALEEKLAWLKSDLEIKHKNFVQELNDKHEDEMDQSKNSYEIKFDELKRIQGRKNDLNEKEMVLLKSEQVTIVRELVDKHNKDIEELTHNFHLSTKALEEKIGDLQSKLEESQSREKTCLDTSKLDRDLRQQALLEIDSLEVVVEQKNKELKKQRLQNSALEEKLQELPLLKDKMTAMERKIEHLESVLAAKMEHEKELVNAQQKLLKKSMDGSEAMKRLSMNNEELMWKLNQSDIGPSIFSSSRHPFSPSSANPKSPFDSPMSASFSGSPLSTRRD